MNGPDDIQQRTANLLAATLQLSVPPENFEQDMHLDSMGVLQLIVALEAEFAVEVDEATLDPLNDFRSVVTIADFARRLLKP